jgi:hypothetical protein
MAGSLPSAAPHHEHVTRAGGHEGRRRHTPHPSSVTMAEIPIERKKSGPGWLPWVAGLLLLLLLGYCFTRNRDADPAVADSAATTDTTGAAGVAAGTAAGAAAGAAGAGGAIDQFVQFVAQRDTTNETEGQHQYTAEGIRRLAAALEGVAGGSGTIQAQADSMRRSVDRLQQSAASDNHADDAKAAFSAAVSAMESIDRARGGSRDVAPMRAIYNELKSGQPLVPQLGTVHRFFEAARDALQGMR